MKIKACEWLYYDFMEEGKGGKQDHWFVRMVWLYIFGKGELGGIEAVGTNITRSIRNVIHGKKVHWYEQKKLMIMLIPINFLKLSPKCKCFLLLEMLRSSVRKDVNLFAVDHICDSESMLVLKIIQI